MNTDQIKQVLEFISDRYFREIRDKLITKVCASDELVNIRVSKVRNSCFIVNTDPSTKPGAHWQVLWFTKVYKKQTCFFMDSYGQPPENESIKKFIKKNSVDLICNDKQLQSFDSSLCGEYCCLFALHMSETDSFHEFTKYYGDNYTKNDEDTKELFCFYIADRIKRTFCNQGCISYNSCK